MKLILLVAGAIAFGGNLPTIAADAPPSSTHAAVTQADGNPSKEEVQKLMTGIWDVSVGPNPFNISITSDTIWNFHCWQHYKILDVRAGKMNKSDAYVISLEITSAGGPGECGQSNDPSYDVTMMLADEVRAGKVSAMSWLVCNSKTEFDEVLKSPDPRVTNERCSSFVTRHITRQNRRGSN